ncbi:putative peptidase C69, dipeptidase A [Plasmopara halstedii]
MIVGLVGLMLAIATLATTVEAKDHCTAIIVGAKTSTTGAPMTTHTNDCSSCDFRIAKVPAQEHKDGALHEVVLAASGYPRYVGKARGKVYLPENLDSRFYNWTTSPSIGTIPEISHTFAYIEGHYGILNEHQLAIGESTCPARFWTKPVTQGGHALFDVSELSRIAMQRSRTAREAIQLMGDLAVRYGYYGAVWEGEDVYDEAGEALTVTDTKEAWMFHILPDDTGKSAIWAAQRVLDDHICGVANQFVIRELDLNRPSDFLASPNVHDVAIRNNIWKPDQEVPFDFTRAYAQPRKATHQYYSTRRIWRLFTLADPELKLSPTTDVLASDYPFSVKPASSLSPRDIMRFQRDHYEGTAFDMTTGPKSGPYGDPDRYDPSPNGDLTKEDIDRGHFERAISIFRASYSFVSILDSENSDNAFLWFGQCAPHATTYTPVFVQSTDVPDQLSRGSLYAFDRESSFWAHALVGNWAARFYSYAHPFVARVQNEVESHAEGMLRNVLLEAAQHKQKGGVPAMANFLTKQSESFAQRAHNASSNLFEYLVTAFHDGYQVSNFYAKRLTVQSIFYPKWWLQQVGFFNDSNQTNESEPTSTKVVTSAPAEADRGKAATATTEITNEPQKCSVSYFTTTIFVILSGLAGLFLGRKFHGPLTTKKQGYRVVE